MTNSPSTCGFEFIPGGRTARLCALSLLALALAACRSHDFPQYPPNYREYAYVTNGGSGTVSVIDVVNVRLDRELPVGLNPVAVTASPTRNEVYVVNSGGGAQNSSSSGSVSIVDTLTNTVAATVAVRRQPVSIELDPAGELAYVANSGSNSISVIDLKARREIAQIGAGEEPVSARIAPDGKTLAVANRQGNSVTLIDPATRTVRQVFEGCPGANDVAILPDSSKAFIACTASHQVMALALAHGGQPDRLQTLMDVGRSPVQLALKPDGGELFVSNSLSGSVSEVVTSTNDVGGAYMIGDDPVRGLVSRDNAMLYVANLQSQYVTVYAIDEGKRIGSIHVGDGPEALAFSSAGHLLFVVDNRSSDVAVVRSATNSLFTLLPTGRAPNAIAVKAFTLP